MTFDSGSFSFLSSEPRPGLPPMFRIHGMFPGGHWRLVITAPEADLYSLRDVTEDEVITPGGPVG